MDTNRETLKYTCGDTSYLRSGFNILTGVQKPMYCDLTHCISGSGGIGSYMLNQMTVNIVTRSELTTKDLDEFSSKLKFPGHISRLGKHFFEERTVHDASSHMRAFASEILTAMDVMALFLEIVLAPLKTVVAVLRDHIQCFAYLRVVLQCIRRGVDPQRAFTAAQKHHELFMQLYPRCGKPKLHYTMHALLSWFHLGCLLQCFGSENEHQQPKRLMAHCYNKCHHTAMKYWLRTFRGHLSDPLTFAKTFLSGPLRSFDVAVQAVGIGTITFSLSSDQVATSSGTYHKNDFVYWCDCKEGGVVNTFIMGKLDNGQPVFVAIVTACEYVGAGFWTPGGSVLVNVERLDGSVILLQEKGSWLRPLPPA